MSGPIRDVETAVAELGALPVPLGLERLTPQERELILGLIGDAKPAASSLLLSFGESVRDRREHDHPKWEDFYCLNLSSYMGERTGPVLRRLVDVEAQNEQLRALVAELKSERDADHKAWQHDLKAARDEREATAARIAELEAAATTNYRAEHPDSGIVLGTYSKSDAAREHCEDLERRSWPTGTTLAFDWLEDEDDGVAELVVTAGQNEESVTGYVVTELEVASEYDAEADE